MALRALVAATEKEEENASLDLRVIHTIAWAVVDLELADTFATGATLPGLPSPRRLIRIKILATAFASRRAASHAENVSV